jgi:hypothetical protein
MKEDGYLFLPGYLDREEVLGVRRTVLEIFEKEGHLEPGHDLMEGFLRQENGTDMSFRPDVTKDNPKMHKLLYSGRMMQFHELHLGGPVLHYDFTWFRAVSPGKGTPPHLDIVYMGRGTKNLYTTWVPMGDVGLELGGLMILENSHKGDRLKANYAKRDVDSFCSNKPHADEYASGKRWWDGWLSKAPVALQGQLGGRWLTSEFKAGDMIVFGMYTVHASLDNQTKCIRLSSDSRYQLASEPADERWIGADPPGHGPRGKKGMIC